MNNEVTPLVPVDMSFVADKVNTLTNTARNKVMDQIKSSVPSGFTVASHRDSVWIGYSEGFDTEHPIISKAKVARVYVEGVWNGEIHIESRATPKDIYRISGLLQVLKGIDSTILGHFSIIN